MKHAVRHSFAVLIAGVALAGTAQARYLCDAPPSPVDKRACAAAEEGPQALRRFIEHMRPIQSLYFYDYVNDSRLLAWDESEKRSRAVADASTTQTAATKNERR